MYNFSAALLAVVDYEFIVGYPLDFLIKDILLFKYLLL
jgi:hypothetical protein